MNLVFRMDEVICSPHEDYNHCRPIENIVEFVQWLKKKDHHVTIWCERELTAENKYITEQWLMLYQIPYDRLLFDRPVDPIQVNDSPSHAKYYTHDGGDNEIVSMLFEEWIEEAREEYRSEMNETEK